MKHVHSNLSHLGSYVLQETVERQELKTRRWGL